MKINQTEKQLQKMLDNVQERCTARTLTVENICTAMKKVEDHLLTFSTKKDAIGTFVDVNFWNQKFPKAYKYIPEATRFTAELTERGWKVSGFYRGKCDDEFAVFSFTKATKDHMAERLMVLK